MKLWKRAPRVTLHPTPTERQREIAAASTQRARDAAMQPARDKLALDTIAARFLATRDLGGDPADLLEQIEEIVRDSGRNLNPPEWAAR